MSRESFNLEFRELLSRNNCESDSLFVYIRMRLNQFKLNKLYQPNDILNEVYMRGIKALEEGKTINSILGWIRGTAYNYIRELSRQESKTKSFEELSMKESNYVTKSLLQQEESLQPQVEEVNNKVEQLNEALKNLTPEEQKLLNYKTVQGLSWQEIHNLEEYQGITPSALRKRKERIIKKLRQCYHSIVKL
ncbi:sigma-70 family RNA polymerase sigma factor [Dapis sp. BLCC M172]|uniref:sigma-70 family RNA polymerase sigma factor n=1 Tax=Dapis sp. BLCC M172 TaxID=2975281 RepID=UPI003CE717FC